MPYDEIADPTEDERDEIFILFKRLIEICYPNCRYITDPGEVEDRVIVKFFSEITTQTEDGEEDNKDRVAAVHGGLDTDYDELHLLIDIGKWRASTFEKNLVILAHEVSHLETPDHDWRFWLDFVQNFELFEDAIEDICEGHYSPDSDELRKEAIHHVNKYNVDLEDDWWIVRRDVADLIGYPMDQYETFEFWSEPVADRSLLDEFRQESEDEFHEEGEERYIMTQPVREEQLSNMELSPKYIQPPDIPEEEIIGRLAFWVEDGIPLLPPPVVEPDPTGPYQIVEGELTVAVAQRIGLTKIDVINQNRKPVLIEDLKTEIENKKV
ncbi:hypothetical protein C482_00135 [Natrialba chahannaoensis JCM 10990]|uniref:Uncharacterized protein n=1 Tax=Natrialba chahannaoensis JCM 10990 TaxID=1227492 RepID=M0B7D3_9EURY|nr:hypothetical protein [Natrialba chahannaoensis]ELZ06183.1 hypothetical protein C482_00135 [Natrialba chahannaoensis JCM 10990]